MARLVRLGFALLALTVSTSACAEMINSGSHDDYTKGAIAVTRTLYTSYNHGKVDEGGASFDCEVRTFVFNGTGLNMTSVALTDSAEIYMGDTEWEIVTKPHKLDGALTCVPDTTFDGDSNRSLLESGASLAPNEHYTVSYTIRVQTDTTETIQWALPVTATGTASGSHSARSLPYMTVPIELVPPTMQLSVTPLPVWVDGTHHDVTFFAYIQNTGLCSFGSPGALRDTTDNYVADYVVTDLPHVSASGVFVDGSDYPAVYGNPTFTGEATLSNPGGATPAYIGMMPAGTWALVEWTIRVTNGAETSFSTRQWANASAISAPCAYQDPVTANRITGWQLPATPGAPIIAGAMSLGTVDGTTGKYRLPVTLTIGNIGTATAFAPQIKHALGGHFPATSGLDSIRHVSTTAPWTLNSGFAGTGNDSLFTALSTDSLPADSSYAVSFDAYFHEGDQTSWSTFARVFTATGSLVDTTNCNVFQGTGGADPNDPTEPEDNTPCTFQSPPATTPATIAYITTNKAGNAIFCACFPQGLIDSSVVVSGNGLAVRDSVGGVLTTQYGKTSSLDPKQPLRFAAWPDGSLRLVEMACKFAVSGRHQIFTPAATQTGSAVTVTEEPFFNFQAGVTTYNIASAHYEGSVLPTDGLVIRRAFADTTDGGAAFQGDPGAMKFTRYNDHWADGSQRTWFEALNQKGAVTGRIADSGRWGVQPTSEAACSLAFVRETSDTMRVRWASDMACGSGADTARVDVWRPTSYNSEAGMTCGQNPQPVPEGASNYGGRFLPGMALRFELVEAQDPDPPLVLHDADWYVSTKAMPFTDTLVRHYGASFASPDSILSIAECRGREWVDGVDDENPIRPSWKNALIVGQYHRAFDAGCLNLSYHVGHDQYEVNLGAFNFMLGMANVSNDSLNAHPTIVARLWKMIEQDNHSTWQTAYHVSYGTWRQGWGLVYPHTEHSSPGRGEIGRSNQAPSVNYMHGLVMYPIAMMRSNPFLFADFAQVRATIDWHITDSGPGGTMQNGYGGEGRSSGNGINWCSLIGDMTGYAPAFSNQIAIARAYWSDKNFNQDPVPNPCGTTWYEEKPWMAAYSAIGCLEGDRVQTRWNRITNASELRTYWQGFANHTATFGTDTKTFQFRNSNNCSQTHNELVEGQFYQYGEADYQNTNPCLSFCEAPSANPDGKSCADFWGVLHAGLQEHMDPVRADKWMRTSAWHIGNGYECPWSSYDNTFQKMGIVMQWYREWAKAHGY